MCNYLPNIEGANTQFILDAINATGMNSQAVVTWQTALNKLANEGKVEKIGTSSSNVDRSKLAPGDLIIFGTAENSHTHIAVYSGTYKGQDFLIHVGNDRGPEIMPVAWMSDSSNGNKASYPNAYFHLPPEFFEDDGTIEIYKKDTDGKALAGATFTATDSATGKSYVIGPTDSKGYAEATLPYATYKVAESKFPTNYRAYGTSSWTVTLNSSSPNGTITINAVNELIPGNCKIVKTSEDGKVDGIDFTITGNGVNKTVTTANGGQITVKDLKPGTYTVTEKAIGGAIHHIGNIHKYARPEDVPEHTMFVITTDGQENASHRYNREQVKKMIERQKEKYGWEFLFIGANIDAVETAARYGIGKDRAVNYNADEKGTHILYESVARAVCNVRASAPLSADWSEDINADYQKRGRNNKR